MAKQPSPNRDKVIYSALTELGRHLRSCKTCMGAKRAILPDNMCAKGKMMTLRAATEFHDIVKMRIEAHKLHPGAIFACPDLAKHGATYALTATPCAVYAIQEALF